jgi:hypothetical protein
MKIEGRILTFGRANSSPAKRRETCPQPPTAVYFRLSNISRVSLRQSASPGPGNNIARKPAPGAGLQAIALRGVIFRAVALIAA